jgi:hypothetical protein
MSVKKYRKKPIVIEALQVSEINIKECYDFCSDIMKAHTVPLELFIGTLEGLMRADVGDWIIKGVNGEFYPCKPDIFDKTYEEVK